MESIVVPAIGICLLAAIPGWRLDHRAYYTSHRWWKIATLIACVLIPPLLAVVLFYIPFIVNKGRELTAVNMFTDFVIYAVIPAAVIGLIGYVMDYLADRDQPRRLVFGGAGCFAVAILPVLFYFYSEQVLTRYGITIAAASGL